MIQLKKYTLIGILFVLITGTLSHFLYSLANNNPVVGLFTPVNESIWEHLKLVYFPMSLYSVFMVQKFKKQFPSIILSLLFGLILGTVSVAVLYYTYTGIFGKNSFFIDILTFILSTVIGFCAVYKTSASRVLKKYAAFLYILASLFLILFLLFTYFPPALEIFNSPA